MTIFYLDACLPTSVGTLNAAAAVRPVGAWGMRGWEWVEKKLENSFERFHRRGSRTGDGGDGIGEFGILGGQARGNRAPEVRNREALARPRVARAVRV